MATIPNTTLINTQSKLLAYFEIARPDHWFKNIFVLPGIALGYFFYPNYWHGTDSLGSLAIAIIATCLVASSNYVINEILDAPSDRHHPLKHTRPIPSGRVNLAVAYCEWLTLAVVGLTLAFWTSYYLGLTCLMLWVMGCLYNIPPIRLKDLPYFDVLSESINNPLRLCIGWYAVGLGSLPPISVILAYWMFGAFLMAVKRFAEYRTIGDGDRAGNYRKSFIFYDEKRLLISIVFYIALFAMFAAVFMVRYRFELILAAPLLAYALAYYLNIGFNEDSPVQRPEYLYREPVLLLVIILNLLAVLALFFIDVPILMDVTHPWHELP